MASAATATNFRAVEASTSSSSVAACSHHRRGADCSASPVSPRSPAPSSSSSTTAQPKQRSRAATTPHSARLSHRGHHSDHYPSSKLDSASSRKSLTRKPNSAPLRISPDPPTLLAFASSFQTLLDSQAPISSTHSAYSELLSVSSSAFPPSTLPISALTDLINANATPSTSSSSKSSFSSVSTSLVDNSNMTGSVATATTAGLDLLGILAEEVDWDPQQRQLAVLGQTLQSHHEAKQKLWAGHILGSLGLIEPDGSRRNSFSTLNSGILPKAEGGYVKAREAEQKTKQQQQSQRRTNPHGDDPLNTMTLTKRTALFYENLYERLCPGIVPRAYIYPKLGRKSHDQDPTFAALALSISLLGLLGLSLPTTPTRAGEAGLAAELAKPFTMPAAAPLASEKRTRAQSPGELRMEAVRLIEKVLLLRLSSTGGGIAFGQTPTLESVLTSFFLSIALHNFDEADDAGELGSFAEWKDASFFRFCEAVTLAKILGIDRVGSNAAAGGSEGEMSEEVRVWALLVRAERWWSERRVGYVCQMEASSLRDGHGGSRKRLISDHNDEDHASIASKHLRTASVLEPLSFLTKLGFSTVYEDLIYRFGEHVDCWSARCHPSTCHMLTTSAAISIHDSLASLDLSHNHNNRDPILLDLARQTLRAKLWLACLHHNFISTVQHHSAAAPLRPDQPLHIALDTLDLLEDLDALVLRSSTGTMMAEAVREAILEIRECVAKLPGSRFAGESFSFELIDAADESEHGSPRGTQEGIKSNSTTTINRAAVSVIDNLDRFLNRVVGH
ncbi:uncharacterized protein UTRI_00042_B [Ustilago trichophora]|uniref:Transcription factor domain-containing protein n=1 Tax=Ustilago trichophora TaxID=86804 RepID=A0A5C3DNJ8_9BASI|nr:uncharacterized protein UTRI_00042_B [Ustilago trichophora]